MTTDAEREQAVAASIAHAPEFAAEHGHVAGNWLLNPRQYVAAETRCTKCRRKIVVDTEGVIGIPKACR
jgi:hypothetical protein